MELLFGSVLSALSWVWNDLGLLWFCGSFAFAWWMLVDTHSKVKELTQRDADQNLDHHNSDLAYQPYELTGHLTGQLRGAPTSTYPPRTAGRTRTEMKPLYRQFRDALRWLLVALWQSARKL